MRSYGNYYEVRLAPYASCFNCMSAVPTGSLRMIHERGTERPTAICPKCGVDSILKGDVRYNILKELNDYFFKVNVNE